MNTIALPVVNETQNVNMSCIVFGLPEPKVTWSRFDTSNLSTAAMSGSKFAIYTTTSYPPDGGVMVHSTLQVNSVNGTDTGNYTCTSENYAHGTNLPADVDEETFHVLVQSECCPAACDNYYVKPLLFVQAMFALHRVVVINFIVYEILLLSLYSFPCGCQPNE